MVLLMALQKNVVLLIALQKLPHVVLLMALQKLPHAVLLMALQKLLEVELVLVAGISFPIVVIFSRHTKFVLLVASLITVV